MKRRDVIKSLSLLGAVPIVKSCAPGVSLGSGLLPQYLISNQMILSELLPHFPYQQSFSGLGSLKAVSPTLSMAPDINKVRMGLGLEASIASQIGAITGIPQLGALAGRTQRGDCQLACGLRYDPKTRGIYLKEPVLESLNLQDIPLAYTDQARSLLNDFGPQFLEKRPVHTLDASFATKMLRSMTVKPEGISLGFGLL